ncbi:MAG: glycosyltransferase family 2 protein [Thermodesulfobacteriota bacterium]
MTPWLDIIIVNWNSGDLLRGCLKSIAAASHHESFHLNSVVVVDNASCDGSADGLGEQGIPLVTVRNKANRGFAAACNQGAKGSKADYLLFLNPDTYLNQDSLVKPLVFMESNLNQHIGIVGIQLRDIHGKISRSCARFPTPARFLSRSIGLDRLFPSTFPSHKMADWEHGESREIDHVIGAFFMTRRSIFEALRGFDERFFVYLEDLDFSFRAHTAGWRSVYLAEATACHKGGGTSEKVAARRLFYSLQSRILYGYKHFARGSATIVMLATLFVEPLARLALAISRRSSEEIRGTIEGYAFLWPNLPRLFKNLSA